MNVMIKIVKSNRKVSPFSGISFVINEIEKAYIPALIDNSFPKRHGSSKYGYADAILSLIYGTICGADRLDDYASLKGKLNDSSLNIPSPVSLGRIMKEKLKTSNTVVGNHTININERLNELLLDIAVSLGQLNVNNKYILDYDNTCIPCEKEDSDWTYLKFRGYQPGVSFIGQIPVYIEGMNGNNNAKFDQTNTLKRTLSNLKRKGIQVKVFRADAASYQSEIFELMTEENITIFVRAENNPDLMDFIKYHRSNAWDTVTLKYDTFEICSFEYTPFSAQKSYRKNQKEYRIVTARRPRADGKPHHITGEPYVYRSIITDDQNISDLEVIATYNQRGAIERNFDVLNNDWNWNKLPFSFLSENTAFMIITAMGLVMYKYIVELFADRVDWIEETDRLKRFRYNVISVAGEWEGDTLMIHDESRPWEQLVG